MMNMTPRQLTPHSPAFPHGEEIIFCPTEYVPELIRKRAYQLFEARGAQAGHELDDWLEAERQIKYELNLWEHYEFKQLNHRFQLQLADEEGKFRSASGFLQSDETHYSRRRREMSFHE
jgi:hypothetical protein